MVFNLWHEILVKLPLVALVFVVWWFIRHEPDESADTDGHDDDGGSKVHPRHGRHPRRHPGPRRPRGPRSPRRGPHGDPATPSPARVRTVTARAGLRQAHH